MHLTCPLKIPFFEQRWVRQVLLDNFSRIEKRHTKLQQKHTNVVQKSLFYRHYRCASLSQVSLFVTFPTRDDSLCPLEFSACRIEEQSQKAELQYFLYIIRF
jgi:hypothetical protein